MHSTRWGHISAQNRDFCLLHLHLTPPLKGRRRNTAIRKQEALLSPRPHDASCLSVVIAYTYSAVFFTQLVYSRRRIRDIEHLKEVLETCWEQIGQDAIDRAIGQFRKRLSLVVATGGGHIEHRFD